MLKCRIKGDILLLGEIYEIIKYRNDLNKFLKRNFGAFLNVLNRF
jgi:hypothetical protein